MTHPYVTGLMKAESAPCTTRLKVWHHKWRELFLSFVLSFFLSFHTNEALVRVWALPPSLYLLSLLYLPFFVTFALPLHQVLNWLPLPPKLCVCVCVWIPEWDRCARGRSRAESIQLQLILQSRRSSYTRPFTSRRPDRSHCSVSIQPSLPALLSRYLLVFHC